MISFSTFKLIIYSSSECPLSNIYKKEALPRELDRAFTSPLEEKKTLILEVFGTHLI
jgi:hypothetical protein